MSWIQGAEVGDFSKISISFVNFPGLSWIWCLVGWLAVDFNGFAGWLAVDFYGFL